MEAGTKPEVIAEISEKEELDIEPKSDEPNPSESKEPFLNEETDLPGTPETISIGFPDISEDSNANSDLLVNNEEEIGEAENAYHPDSEEPELAVEENEDNQSLQNKEEIEDSEHNVIPISEN